MQYITLHINVQYTYLVSFYSDIDKIIGGIAARIHNHTINNKF